MALWSVLWGAGAAMWEASAGSQVKGEHVVTEDGVLVISWDNRHSMMRSKTVTYAVAIEAAAAAASASGRHRTLWNRSVVLLVR